MATLLDIIKKDSTNRSVTIRIIDDTDGTPETGVVFNTAGIDLWYRRESGLKISITEADLVTPALDDPHLDGGFLHISDGEYRLDLPDAASATGANYVDVGGIVTGMVVIGGRVRLVDYDPESATNLGLTNLDDTVSSRMAEASIATTGGAVDTVTVLTGHTAQTADHTVSIAAIPTTAMRGTDNAALASVATEARLAELDAANLPADIDTINTAVAALNDLSTVSILAMAYEGTETFQDFMRLVRSAIVGKLAGAATTTITMRDKADIKNRITATVDADGNRTAVTTDAT